MTEAVQRKSTLRSRTREPAHTPLRGKPRARRKPEEQPKQKKGRKAEYSNKEFGHYLITVDDWKRLLGGDEKAPERIEAALPDWRWDSQKRIRLNKRLGGGVPEEMREAVDAMHEATGLARIEVVRRALHQYMQSPAWKVSR